MFRAKAVEKIKTHILWSATFFFENRAVREIMWENAAKQGRPQHDNMTHAHCMLDT